MAREAKIYQCCKDPKCSDNRNLLFLLRLWGIEPVVKSDAVGLYYQLLMPEYWSEKRVNAFDIALADRQKRQKCRNRVAARML